MVDIIEGIKVLVFSHSAVQPNNSKVTLKIATFNY